MTTAETFTPSSTMILVLGGCVLVALIALIVIVVVGLRALMLGRDHVCAFSWRFALELFDHLLSAGRSVQRVQDLPAMLNTFSTPTNLSPIPDRGFFRMLPLLYLRVSFLLLRRKLRRVQTRRTAQQGTSYQTYGARMRARAVQQAA